MITKEIGVITMKRRVMDYILILLSAVFTYCFCAMDLSDTYAYYNPYNTTTLPAASGRQNTTYPTILQTGFSGLGQSFGLGGSLFGLPVAPNLGNLFPAISFGTGAYGIYAPGVASSSLLGLGRFAAGGEDDLVRVAHPTNFPLVLNQNPITYPFLETPEMNYYNFLGTLTMLANPFEYARAGYINPLYQNPYMPSSAYQTSLPNFSYSSYHDPLSMLFGSLSYQDPFNQFLGQYPDQFHWDYPPVISPDYSSKMYVTNKYVENGVTVYLIVEDNSEGPPKNPGELGIRARKFVKLEEYNSTFDLYQSETTCDICLYKAYPDLNSYQGFLVPDRVWAWAKKWWSLED